MSHLREFDSFHFTSAANRLDRPSLYLIKRARRDELSGYEKLKASLTSATVYVGHLTLNTTEEQIYELFSTVGPVERVIMGLNAHDQSPTGFCFVIFKSPKGALNAVKYINKTKLNGKAIEIDLDPGFEDGRQYGRGENGAQKASMQRRNNRFNTKRGRGGYRGRGGRGGRGGRDRARNGMDNTGYQGNYQFPHQYQQQQPLQQQYNQYQSQYNQYPPQQYPQQYAPPHHQQQYDYNQYQQYPNNQYPPY
ncbi:Nuclear cap-binding protein subunit 2 [Pichia kudriavzevii]|uniref:Nuclear cap-binding protein subunit 2 n=2 Tax=Pichia kudriavzevii TaxID=4909 RepID=A0A1V2LT35_PICKU|nr:Nuclear cap-binding protein subunit 2 [Pichia kudriavzevii]